MLRLRGGAPKKKRCTFRDCTSLPQNIVGDCSFCDGHYCGKHRLLEDHKCPGLEDVRSLRSIWKSLNRFWLMWGPFSARRSHMNAMQPSYTLRRPSLQRSTEQSVDFAYGNQPRNFTTSASIRASYYTYFYFYSALLGFFTLYYYLLIRVSLGLVLVSLGWVCFFSSLPFPPNKVAITVHLLVHLFFFPSQGCLDLAIFFLSNIEFPL